MRTASRITRRRLLQVGGLGLLGLSLPALLRAEHGGRKARAKSVIFLHQYGGPSHHDTFDMKPAAPDAIRGEFKPIATRTPGIQICEVFPRLASHMDKAVVIRSMVGATGGHDAIQCTKFPGQGRGCFLPRRPGRCGGRRCTTGRFPVSAT